MKRVLPLFAITLLLLVFASCVTSSGGAGDSDQSLPEELLNAPDHIWRIPLRAAEVDFAEFVDTDTLLMSTQIVYGNMQNWGIRPHEIVLADLNSGTGLWHIGYSEVSSSLTDVFADEESVFIFGYDYNLGAQRLTAISRTGGSVSWSNTFPAGIVCEYDSSAGLIICAGNGGDGFQITALDTLTGEPVWTTRVDGAVSRDTSPACDILFDGETCIVVGKRAASVNTASGEPIWNSGLESDLHFWPVVSINGSLLVINSQGKLAIFNTGNGGEMWSTTESEALILSQVISGERVYVAAEDGTSRQTLSCFRLNDGVLEWQVPIESKFRSSISVYGDAVFYSTGQTLSAVDSGTGQLLLSLELPGFMHTSYGLPDQIFVDETRLLLNRETGLAVFDRGSSGLLFSHSFPGTEVFTFHVSSQRLIQRQIARSGGSIRIDSEALTGELQNQVIRNNTGVDPQFAHGMPRTASQAQTEATMAAANMAAAVAAAGIAYREEAVAKNMYINEKEITAAISSHSLSVQNGYILRPFFRNGWGVSLVKIEDGSRADLYVSQPFEPLEINSGNFPMFFIDPDGQRLVVNGIGREIYPDETYEKVGFPKDVFKVWPGIPPKWVIPYISVFGYDLDSIGFAQASSFEIPADPVPLGEKEIALRNAIMSRNRNEVDTLIESGADVNAVDQAGLNALFYTAMVDDKNMTNSLIKAGGDATLRDPHGLLAYHYTFLTHGDNRTTMIYRAENLKQLKK